MDDKPFAVANDDVFLFQVRQALDDVGLVGADEKGHVIAAGQAFDNDVAVFGRQSVIY